MSKTIQAIQDIRREAGTPVEDREHFAWAVRQWADGRELETWLISQEWWHRPYPDRAPEFQETYRLKPTAPAEPAWVTALKDGEKAGRVIQFRNETDGWLDSTSDDLAFIKDHEDYRLKPVPTVRWWTQDTFPTDRPVWVRKKHLPTHVYQVTSIHNGFFYAGGVSIGEGEQLRDSFVQHDRVNGQPGPRDGKPCGVEG